jgi:hypothetical protein
MTKQFHLQISDRDIEILSCLDHAPFTPSQLFSFSQTFTRPFGNPQNLRRRLRELKRVGLVQSYQYAIANNGRAPSYFKLTRTGFKVLFGHHSALPKRRYFESISDSHHHHTHCLSEFIVALQLACSRNDFALKKMTRENSVCIETKPFRLFPDCTFQISVGKKQFNYVVELDNGTERIRSARDVESIERKIRGYEAFQSQFGPSDAERFIVLFVTTRSQQRLDHMLDAVDDLTLNSQRTNFLGTSLEAFRKADNPFAENIWLDHNGRKRPLIRLNSIRSKNSQSLLTPTLQLC